MISFGIRIKAPDCKPSHAALALANKKNVCHQAHISTFLYDSENNLLTLRSLFSTLILKVGLAGDWIRYQQNWLSVKVCSDDENIVRTWYS